MGTGSTLALLPAENATGNFVKVVQRLPVRIELTNYDPDVAPLFIADRLSTLGLDQGSGFSGTALLCSPASRIDCQGTGGAQQIERGFRCRRIAGAVELPRTEER
jgi:hypothetical protein